MLIRAENLLHLDVPKTYLTHDEVAGTSVIRWSNPSGFSASWAIQVGEVGDAQAEVVILSSSTPAGTAGTLTANTLYAHPANTPIYAIKFDKVVFSRSTAGTAGTAVPMTGGTVTYQANLSYTGFDDTTGVSTYAYKTNYLNSVTSAVSSESDWSVPAGDKFYSLAALRNRVRERLWDSSYIKDDSTIDNWINEWKDEMANTVIAVNEDYALGTVNVAFGTAGLGTITEEGFSSPRSLWVTTNGQDYFLSHKMYVNNFDPQRQFSPTMPFHYWQGDNVFGVKPEGQAGTARIVFYTFGTTMAIDTDLLPVPMRPYTKSFVDYALAQAYMKDQKSSDYDRLLESAERSKREFLLRLSPKDKTGPTQVNIVEPISADDVAL